MEPTIGLLTDFTALLLPNNVALNTLRRTFIWAPFKMLFGTASVQIRITVSGGDDLISQA
jgi:hypothetical protein